MRVLQGFGAAAAIGGLLAAVAIAAMAFAWLEHLIS